MAETILGRDILGKRGALDREHRLVVYDFKRPDWFSKEQMRSISMILATFARLASVRISIELRKLVDFEVKLVDQMTFAEFLEATPSPTLLALAGLEPLNGTAIFEIEPSFARLALERLFGGSGEASGFRPEPGARACTNTELSAIEPLLKAVVAAFGEAWAPVQVLTPALRGVETNPFFAHAIAPSWMVVTARLEAKIGPASCGLRLCFPALSLEPLLEKLGAEYHYFGTKGKKAGPTLSEGSTASIKADAELVCEGPSFSLAELAALRAGSLIDASAFAEGRLWLRVGGAPVLELGSVRNSVKPISRIARVARNKNAPRHWRLAVEKGSRKPGEDLVPGLSDMACAEGRIASAAAAAAAAAAGAAVEAALGPSSLGGRMDGLTRGIVELRKAVEAVEGSQESLADQVLYGEGRDSAAGAGAEGRLFADFRIEDSESLALFLGGERPQLAALVLSRLDKALAADLLGRMPEESQADIARRICVLERVSPGLIATVFACLRERLRSEGAAGAKPRGGIGKIVGILNESAREVEKRVIMGLDRSDPALAEEIKKNMFVFEDICLLEPESIRLSYESADRRDFSLAMKPAPDRVKEAVYAALGEAAAAGLRASRSRPSARRGSPSATPPACGSWRSSAGSTWRGES